VRTPRLALAIPLALALPIASACSGDVGGDGDTTRASTGGTGGASSTSSANGGGSSTSTTGTTTTNAGGAGGGTTTASGGAGGATGTADPNDDASIEAAAFPQYLGCTAKTLVVVTVKNTGSSTWTKAGGFALAPIDAADALHPGGAVVDLGDGDSVPPGATHDFSVPLAATGKAGSSTTAWRMTHAGAAPFGATASGAIAMNCENVTPGDFDLGAVNIVSSPDVRPFAVTSHITSLAFSPGTIHVDHEKRGQWPPVVIADDGTTQEATIWVFFHIAGAWYGTGGERLRPDQTDKSLDQPSQIGPGWLYDPNRWHLMTGYVPSPGDLVAFLVAAGSTRSDDNVAVQERTAAVLVPFPADGVATSFPPFAWQEAGP
jgi:hypothetical protein